MRGFAFLLTLISGIFIAAAVFLWFAAGEIYDYKDSYDIAKDAAQTDVVLVLAGGKKRIPDAVELWTKVRAIKKADHLEEPVLFLSGIGHTTSGTDTLVEQGIPKEIVAEFTKENAVFENVSENTFENAQLFSSFVRQKKWKHVVLVTAGYHMRRAHFILGKVLDPDVEVWTKTVDVNHFDRNEWRKDEYAIRVTLFEYIKWLYYRYNYR
jgi:uncharacterized SAM-binding protein YcdF (DUF218 family)